jgi:type III secretion protein V
MLGRILRAIAGRQDLAVVFLLLLAVVLMVLPINTVIMDFLIAANLCFAVLILVVSLLLKRPDEFSTFPAIILISTVFRLAIAVATTRLILSTGEAGHIVETFGKFVTGGSVGIGLVIFLIVAVVQFIVVTKGAERIAEVAARFTLDAMPGRQLSIDAEARAGDITGEEAKRRRKNLDRENQFFGAMDGAMKFVKGDAVAGIIIILINLIGGISVGMLSRDMSFSDTVNLYAKLTVGDGLVQQIPALLMALCAGTVVTRVTTDEGSDLGADITKQIITNPKTLLVAAVASFMGGLVPGFPVYAFWFMAALFAGGAYVMSKREKETANAEAAASGISVQGAGKAALSIVAGKASDPVVLRLGKVLFEQVNNNDFAIARSDMMTRFQNDLGFSVPVFSYMEAFDLGDHEVAVDFEGVSLDTAEIPLNQVLLISTPEVASVLAGRDFSNNITWPAVKGVWVPEAEADSFAAQGVEVKQAGEAVVLFAEHLLRNNAHMLLNFETVQTIFTQLRKENQGLAEQAAQAVTAMRMLDIMRRLVAEGVPLAPRRKLFEALLDWPSKDFDPALVTEHVRKAMRRHICARFADQHKVVATYLLEPELEAAIIDSITNDGFATKLKLAPSLANVIVNQVSQVTNVVTDSGKRPAIIIANEVRRFFAEFIESQGLRMPVLANQELAPEFNFQPVGTFSMESQT